MSVLHCSSVILIFAVATSWINSADSRVIGAAVIPHGDFALDPSIIHNVNGSLEIHEASLAVGGIISSLKPDLVLLSTPHGLATSRDFFIYLNTNASGYALIGQDLHNSSIPSYKVPLDIQLAPERATSLLNDLISRKFNVSGLLGYGNGDDMPIRWGEIIPLWFFMNHHHADAKPQTLIVSHPLRRTSEGATAAYLGELAALGEAIMTYLESLDQRVYIVISSDLAHTHSPEGPYGFSPAAQPFDDACGEWAATLNPKPLLVDAAALLNDAKSCGYTGLVMLNSMLQSTMKSHNWKPKLYVNRWPTYYGMMVATFTSHQQHQLD